jgi:hypothetical protein
MGLCMDFGNLFAWGRFNWIYKQYQRLKVILLEKRKSFEKCLLIQFGEVNEHFSSRFRLPAGNDIHYIETVMESLLPCTLIFTGCGGNTETASFLLSCITAIIGTG